MPLKQTGGVRALPAAVAVRLRVRDDIRLLAGRRNGAVGALMVVGVALTGAVRTGTGGAASPTALATGNRCCPGWGCTRAEGCKKAILSSTEAHRAGLHDGSWKNQSRAGTRQTLGLVEIAHPKATLITEYVALFKPSERMV